MRGIDEAYQITEFSLSEKSEWKIISYSSYQNYILRNSYQELIDIMSFVDDQKYDENFKWSSEIGTIQYVLGVFPKDKTLYIASKNLSFELSILQINPDHELKKHVNKIASIPLENTPTNIDYRSYKYQLPKLNTDEFKEIDIETSELADKLIVEVNKYRFSLFEKVSDFGLDLTANFMLIRVHLLKFLAILPSLDHDEKGSEVKRILLETLRRMVRDSKKAKEKKYRGQKRALPDSYVLVCSLVFSIAKYTPAILLAYIVRLSVSVMAKRFIAGENIYKAKKSLASLTASGRDATIDQLGELVVSHREAEEYTEKVIKIIQGLSSQIEKGTKNSAGINKAHVSIKVSALANNFKPQDYKYTFNEVAPRLRRILSKACESDIFVNIDAEHYHYRDIVLKIYGEILLNTEELKNYAQTGIVVQAYLRDGAVHFNDVLALAMQRNICMPIRLVKGAYWDAETIEGDAHNFDAPQFLNKEETDIHFRQLVFRSLEKGKYIQLAVASHNIQDHCFSETLRSQKFPEAPVIEHQCLHMTYEALSTGLAAMNWPVRNYIPVGNLLVGMAYLVRRIMENSSQVGILTIMRSHKKGVKVKSPYDILDENKQGRTLVYDSSISELSRDFKNIYPLRTYLERHFLAADQVLEKLKNKILGGELVCSSGDIEVVCSSSPEHAIGKVSYNTVTDVQEKITHLHRGFQHSDWKNNFEKRSMSLYRLADLLLEQREHLSSLIMLEAGKTLDEACADVDEAYDFIHFYLKEQALIEGKGAYGAKGVIGVIAPWNFPLAIACGMSVAAIVAGNTAILKPAEQTPLIGLKFIELCRLAGIPAEILDIVLGEGEIGAAIVNNDLVNGIVFTGSKAVGEKIYQKISREITSSTSYDYKPGPKFAITEMGGKNAIIVTNNCELDETVSGIIYSAFAHAGQKCSAASRIIIDNEVKAAFIKRFIDAVKDVKVGVSFHHSTVINPLVSLEDKIRVQSLAGRAQEEVLKFGGRVLLDDSKTEYPGFCVGPSVFELSSKTVLNNTTMATEEVFGPMIHLVGYDDLDEALQIFNSTDYALTGGIFCQSQDDIDYLSPRMNAGNIYVNRPNTGARVGIEPFGGFKMSGTGPKAGGVDYLSKFNRLESEPGALEFGEVKDFESIKVDIAQNSKLSQEKRHELCRNFLVKITHQVDRYFPLITEEKKDEIIDLQKFIASSKVKLDSREFPHRYIPGQVSFGIRDRKVGVGLVLSRAKNISHELFIDVLLNIVIGNGISLLCSTSESYLAWKEVIELAKSVGISTYNLNISLITESETTIILKEADYSFVLTETANLSDEIRASIYSRDFSDKLIKIFSSVSISFDERLKRYTHCRSFAINTMRHGAPLELTL